MTALICFWCSKYIRILDLSRILRKESVSNHMQSNGNGTNLIQNREWHKYKITLWYFIIYNISPCSKVFRVQRIFFAKSLSYQICKLVWTERVCHYVPDFDQVCSCSILSMYNWDSTQISVRADWWLICLRMLRWMLRMQDSGWRGRGQPRQPRYGLGTDIWHVTMLHGSVTAASPAAHSSAILASTFESD